MRHDFALSRSLRSDDPTAPDQLTAVFAELEEIAQAQIGDDPDFAAGVRRERRCDIRYLGQAYEVAVALDGDGAIDRAALDELVSRFHDQHERAYAFSDRDAPCEILIQRLSIAATVGERVGDGTPTVSENGSVGRAQVVHRGAKVDCVVVDRSQLRPGEELQTPAILVQHDTTTFLPPGVRATVAPTGDLIVTNIQAP